MKALAPWRLPQLLLCDLQSLGFSLAPATGRALNIRKKGQLVPVGLGPAHQPEVYLGNAAGKESWGLVLKLVASAQADRGVAA